MTNNVNRINQLLDMSDNHKLLSAIVNQNNTSISYWKQLTEVLKKAGISLQLELYMNTLHLW